MAVRDPEEVRRKFVEAWNMTMIDIWQERIRLLGVIDTWELYHSQCALPVQADGRFYSFELSQTFLEYGLWQDFGTGREKWIGNPGDIGDKTKSGKPRKFREARPWFSTKYYSSVMKIRDFMARSLGDEFKAMFCNQFDADRARRSSEYYRSKGLS